jgi:hypothetical protein
VDLTERPEIFFTAGILPVTSRLKPSGPIDRHATDSKVRKPQWILLNSHTVVKRFCETKNTVPVPVRHKSEIRMSKSETNADADEAEIGKIQNVESERSLFEI